MHTIERDEVSALRQENRELVETLRLHQWSRAMPVAEGDTFHCCPECEREHTLGHAESCELGKLLARHRAR
jgi:hypothetical protein